MSKVIEVAQHQWQKRPLLWLFIFIAILNLPIFLGIHPLKWDAIDISYPQRRFVSICLRNAVLPLWNPFQLFGFATGYLPETWYPIPLLFGLACPYPLWGLNLEYVFHLWMAAWGIWKVCHSMNLSKQSAFWASLVFASNGFFMGHPQHLGWIIAGAWLPHVWYHYRTYLNNIMNGSGGKHGFLCIWYGFLLISGGYTAFSIISIYLLLGYTLYFLIAKRKDLIKHINALSLLAVGLLLISAVLWKSNIYLFNHLERGQGLMNTLEGSWRWWHVLSLLAPSSLRFGGVQFWQADISLINAYFSIPGLLLILQPNLYRDRQYLSLMVAGLISFLLALGMDAPFRQWLNVLPGFNLFRFPALFRYFGLIFWILAAAIAFDNVTKEDWGVKRLLVPGTLILIAGILLCFIPQLTEIRSSLLLETVMIGVCIALLYILRQQLALSTIIIAWTIFNVGFSKHTLGPITGYNSNIQLWEIHKCLKELPDHFKPPPMRPLSSMPDKNWQIQSVYRNTNTLFHKIGFDGYTPYLYNDYQRLEKNPDIFPYISSQPLLFVAAKTGKTNEISQADIQWNVKDTIDFISFQPNRIQLDVQLHKKALIVLNQNYDAEWTVSVDGKKAVVQKCFGNLMAVDIPSGEHTLEWKYEPNSLYIGLAISGSVLLIGLFIYLGIFASTIEIWSCIAIVGFTIIGFFCSSTKSDKTFIDLYSQSFVKADGPKSQCFYRDVLVLDSIPEQKFWTNPMEFDFDIPKASWANTEKIVWSPEWNHQRVQEISNDYPYSATYSQPFVSETADYLTFQVDVKADAATIVLSLQIDEDSTKFERYVSMDINGSDWQTIQTKFDLTSTNNGNLKVYCGHAEGSSIFIDNLKIAFDQGKQQ